jgi:hypothetical protein
LTGDYGPHLPFTHASTPVHVLFAQHGSWAAPHATHASAAQTVLGAAHAAPPATH